MCEFRHTHYGHGRPNGHRSMRRRTARVPKGLLRHYVLKLLDENPMSGSEIMSTISARTENRWEPSPGSVYPLLSWLLDSGFTKISEDQDVGIKRYGLTDEGKKFLEEHDENHPDFDQRILDTGPHFRGDMSRFPKEVRELFKDFRIIRRSSRRLLRRLEKDYSEETVEKAKAAIAEFIEKLDLLSEFDESKE